MIRRNHRRRVNCAKNNENLATSFQLKSIGSHGHIQYGDSTKDELHEILMAYEMRMEKKNDSTKEYVFNDTRKSNVASSFKMIHLTYQIKKKQIS